MQKAPAHFLPCLLALALFQPGCDFYREMARSSASAPSPALEQGAGIEAVEDSKGAVPALGYLVDYCPPATVQRREAPLAQEVREKNIALFAFDRIRTDVGGCAHFSFLRGAQYHAQEKSRFVIGPEKDRIIARSGEGKAETAGELRILTSAALLRLSRASASFSISEGKRLKVILQQGKGELLRVKLRKGRAIPEVLPLEPGLSRILEAPPAGERLSEESSERVWREGPRIAEKPPIVEATSSPKASSIISLFVDYPPDYKESAQAEIEIRGRVSAQGGTLRVNGALIAVQTDLKFAARVPLRLGTNTIIAQLVEPTGSSVYERRVVVRKR